MVEAEKFIEEKVGWLKENAEGKNTVWALSGGVDSSVVAMLGHRAIPDDMTAVFLDDGLMRKDEPQWVKDTFAGVGIDVKVHDVASNFFDALKGHVEAEDKRKAFREAFYSTFANVAKEHEAEILLQGTIAADIKETQGGIKSQHNILEQIGINPLEKYGYTILEPVKELYKPGVREIARALDMPKEISERMPFPGPGLATRVLGEVTPEKVAKLRDAMVIVEEETKDIPSFQAFAVITGDRGTGMTEGGERRYGEMIIVRVVQSTDAITADVVELPWETLNKIRERITSSIPDVTHVMYDLTPKPPATIEFV